MKYIIAALALAGLMGATALADATGGIVGTVVDTTTGKALPNVPITIMRIEARPEGWNMKTNSKGGFANITLQPGRYLVVATFPGETVGCAIDDVFGGQVVHLKIGVGGSKLSCDGPRAHPALVDPSAVSDVYRIPAGPR
jgi:Carboxypeptidase regulatory-like domain